MVNNYIRFGLILTNITGNTKKICIIASCCMTGALAFWCSVLKTLKFSAGNNERGLHVIPLSAVVGKIKVTDRDREG